MSTSVDFDLIPTSKFHSQIALCYKSMKLGKTLNPYAESFTPLCRRGRDDKSKAANIPMCDTKISDETTKCEQAPEGVSRGSDVFSGDSESVVNIFNSSSKDSMPVNPNDGNEKQIMGEDFEFDLAYLSATFPGLSEQSLVGVYFANDGDLEASVDMLSQLELPHTYDFGETSDSGASVKQKMTDAGEASGLSDSSDLTLGPDQ